MDECEVKSQNWGWELTWGKLVMVGPGLLFIETMIQWSLGNWTKSGGSEKKKQFEINAFIFKLSCKIWIKSSFVKQVMWFKINKINQQ